MDSVNEKQQELRHWKKRAWSFPFHFTYFSAWYHPCALKTTYKLWSQQSLSSSNICFPCRFIPWLSTIYLPLQGSGIFLISTQSSFVFGCIVPLKIHIHTECANVNLFGKSFFEITDLKIRSSQMGMGTKFNEQYPFMSQRGRRRLDSYTEEKAM